MLRNKIRVGAGILFLLLCTLGIVMFTSNGHLLPLLTEGYPKAVWPAPGHFAPLKGSPKEFAVGDAVMSELDPPLAKLFAERGGRALLAFHRGRLVVEHYGQGYDRETQFNSYSMVKSLVGALVAKAQSDGKIDSVLAPIGQYLPAVGDERFRRVPIVDFLTMQSGVVFEPSDDKHVLGFSEKNIDRSKVNPFGPMAKLHYLGVDSIAAGLRVLENRRGQFDYQNVNTAVLGKLLETVYETPLETLLSEHIWSPAGARVARWRRYSDKGPVTPYCCVYATARDWLKVGLFLMKNGRDERFLPKGLWHLFFDTAKKDLQVKTYRYGFQIRHDVLDRARARIHGDFSFMLGRGGQIVYMMPQKDLVVVRFGDKHQLLHSTLYRIWDQIERIEGSVRAN